MVAPKDFERLPAGVVPVHYDLRLDINLDKLCFKGEEIITLEVKQATSELRLNSIALSVTDVWVSISDGSDSSGGASGKRQHPTISLEASKDLLVLTLTEELPVGTALLHIAFSAPLEAQMRGLYKSKYTGVDGSMKWMAVTQFEAASARRCFPCFDEPALKATFTLTVTAPTAATTVLSNMPEEDRQTDASDSTVQIIKFSKTPKMSTYLLALVVGEYDHIERTLSSGVLVRVFTPKGLSSQGELSLDVACRALHYYADYFKIAYPLPKLDLITVPDFSAGAMENWGLVTFREVLLLVDDKNSSTHYKQRITITIAHELAHQWFGNIVTMEWWTHLWLNEGYANFTQMMCANHMFPEYEIWTQYLCQSFIPAMELDGLKNTHPIEVPVSTPDEVDEIFDEISYDKGSSVIRMLYHYLGDEDFQSGMHLYLTRHQYGNTFTEDLWAALAEVSGKPVEKVMSTWTKKPGFPMLNVEAEVKEDSTVLTFTQSRFLINGEKDETAGLWVIPVEVICSMDGEARTMVLETATGSMILPKLPKDGWVKVNTGSYGFYRTRYSQDLQQRLIPAIREQRLSPLDRLNIVDDLNAMVKAGHSSTIELLKLVQVYKEEQDYTVWLCLRNCLTDLTHLLSHKPELKGLLSPLVIQVFGKINKKLGWEEKEGENYLDRLLRPVVLGTMAEHGDVDVLAKARDSFDAHVAATTLIPADLKTVVYKACMMHGDQKTMDALLTLFSTAMSQEDRDRVSRSLGAARGSALHKQVIEFALKKVRLQDTPFVLYSLAYSSPEGARAAWDYFKQNYALFIETLSNSDLMIYLCKFMTENFASEEDAKDIKTFFAGVATPVGEQGVTRNIESILVNAAWLSRDGEQIRAFIEEFNKKVE